MALPTEALAETAQVPQTQQDMSGPTGAFEAHQELCAFKAYISLKNGIQTPGSRFILRWSHVLAHPQL